MIGGIGFCVLETLISLHPSSGIEAVCSRAALLTKMDRRHRMTKSNPKFCILKKKTRNFTEIRFLPIRIQLIEPLSADTKQWFENVYWFLLTNIYLLFWFSCCVGLA